MTKKQLEKRVRELELASNRLSLSDESIDVKWKDFPDNHRLLVRLVLGDLRRLHRLLKKGRRQR